MNQNDNLLGIIAILYKWRKNIIITCIIAGILSIIGSLLLPNYYQSTTVFYAASPDLAKPSPLGSVESDKDFYGEEEDLDRLFSISSSSEVVDYLIAKYNLYDHYDIDPKSKKGPFKIKERFNKMYKTLKTKFGALQLSVEDQDPALAANITNDARDKINEISQRLIKQSQQQLLTTYESNILEKDKLAKQLSDSLYKVREKYAIYNTDAQGMVYAELLAKASSNLNDKKARLKIYKSYNNMQDSIIFLKAMIEGLESQYSSVSEKVNLFNKGLSNVTSLEFEQKDMIKQLSLDKERFKQLQATYNTPFNGIHVIEKGEVPIVKSRPKRSIIVIGICFVTFIFSIIGVILLESYRKIDWQKIKNNA